MFVVTGSDQQSDCWVHLWDYCDLLLWKWTSGRRSCCWGRMAAVRCSQLKLYTLKFMQISQYVKIQVIYKIILVQLLWIFISHGFGFCEGLHTIHYVSASLVILMLAQTGQYTCLGDSSQTILTSDAITQLSSGCCHLQAITVAKIFIHVPNSTGVTQWLH